MSVTPFPPRPDVPAHASVFPPSLLAELDTALEVAAGLARASRALHIGQDDLRRLQIEVRDAEGRLLRTLRPTEALDLAAGRVVT